jgi:hypothetical protein
MDFIERAFGFSPDGGPGLLEGAVMLAILFVGVLFVGWMQTRRRIGGAMHRRPRRLAPRVSRSPPVAGGSETEAQESPNMCFDGSDPVTEIQYKGQVLDALLDTDNEETELWPSFARRFLPEINPSEMQSHQVAGFDGISDSIR